MAGGGGGEDGEGRPVKLDMTAMIDVIFLLLIFFMLGTKFREFEGKLSMQLPLKATSKAKAVNKPKIPPIIIQVNTRLSTDKEGKPLAIGEYKLQGTAVTEDSLQKEIGAKRVQSEKPEDQPVQIQATKTAHFINILKALDACSFNKLTNVSMEYAQ